MTDNSTRSNDVVSRVMVIGGLPNSSDLLKYLMSLTSTTGDLPSITQKATIIGTTSAESQLVTENARSFVQASLSTDQKPFFDTMFLPTKNFGSTFAVPTTSNKTTTLVSPLSTEKSMSQFQTPLTTMQVQATTFEPISSLLNVATSTLKNVASHVASAMSTKKTEINAPSSSYRAFPIFCSKSTATECLATPLRSCDTCSQPCAAAFLSVIVLLALVILVANSVVLLVVRNKKRKGKLENMDLHRVSLAIADILTGLQLLIVPAFNFAWVMNSTTIRNLEMQVAYRDSSAAKFGGIFFVLTYTASLFNLLYLAAQLLFAFVSPINYKLQRQRSIAIGLVIMWLIAVVTSTLPAWVPDNLAYSFAPTTFLFYPVQHEGTNIATVSALMAVMYILPYVLTVVLIIASTCIVSKHMKRRTHRRSIRSAPKDVTTNKIEVQYFITSFFMVVGFTLTAMPIVGVVIYQYATGSLEMDLAYVICFYVSMANSLVNVLVYSSRDAKFSKLAKDMFCSCAQFQITKRILSRRKRTKSASESIVKTGMTPAVI